MKIIVLSDTHGRVREAIDIISACQNGLDAVVHLGDTVKDFENIKSEFSQISFTCVAGNNDFWQNSFDKDLVLNLDGVKMFLTHGHAYSVKSTMDKLILKGIETGVDIVLFGHTHVSEKFRFQNTLFFNPGSLLNNNFGIIHTKDGALVSAESFTWDSFLKRIN